MNFDSTPAMRYSVDYGALATVSIVGFNRYQVFLVSSTDPPIDLDTLNNSIPTLTSQRITVADGYRPWIVPGDGYMYPMVKETSTNELLASGQVLSVRQVLMGPLVLPYTYNSPFAFESITGGIDPSFFAPFTNYWVQIIGEGLMGGHGNGAFYDIKEIRLQAMKILTYYVVLESTSSSPPGQ